MPSFQGVGVLSVTDPLSRCYGVSPDGNHAFGYSRSSDGAQAFRWTANTMTRMLDINPPGIGQLPQPPYRSNAISASEDGSIVVGRGTSMNAFGLREPEAFHDSQNSRMFGLGRLANPNNLDWDSYSEARDVSYDGAVVVGRSWSGKNDRDAVVWKFANGQWTLKDLTPLQGNRHSAMACGISGNGLVTVGKCDTGNQLSNRSTHAVRWTRQTTQGSWGAADSLHPPGSTAVFGKALGVSENGSVIVGQMDVLISAGPPDVKEFVAFRYDEQTGPPPFSMVPLAIESGDFVKSRARGVSGDGSVVVGEFDLGTGTGDEAFLWTTSVTHLKRLSEVLRDDFNLGTDLDGWILQQAHGVSHDGLVVVGSGMHLVNEVPRTEGWVASMRP